MKLLIIIFDKDNNLIIRQEIEYPNTSNIRIDTYNQDVTIKTTINNNQHILEYTLYKINTNKVTRITLTFIPIVNNELQLIGFDINSNGRITTKTRLLD